MVRYPANIPDDQRPRTRERPAAAFTDDGFLDVVQEVKLNDVPPSASYFSARRPMSCAANLPRTGNLHCRVFDGAGGRLIAVFCGATVDLHTDSAACTIDTRVSTEHNYTLTASSHGHDERGVLCDRFNPMLAEIRRRDDELNQSNEELLRSNDELRQFADVASHHLQEPLRSVSSFCNMLKEEYEDRLDAQVDKYVERIAGGAARMKALVIDPLTYSRAIVKSKIRFSASTFKMS